MKLRLPIIILFLMLSFSCRKKIAEDYKYYKPYKRAVVSVNDTVTSSQQNDSVQSKNIVAEEIKPVDLNQKYFIVVASFSVEEYAITMKYELIKQGYKPEIFVLRNDGWNKVAILSYNNFEEATRELDRIKLRGGMFSNARIVIK
jgi:cell division protein FtsN